MAKIPISGNFFDPNTAKVRHHHEAISQEKGIIHQTERSGKRTWLAQIPQAIIILELLQVQILT